MFDWENAIALAQYRGIGPHLPGGERLMGFLELRQEPVVYSRVAAGMSIRKSSLFIEVRNLSRYEGQLRNVNRRGRKIQTLLEVKWEFRSLFLFDTVILGLHA